MHLILVLPAAGCPNLRLSDAYRFKRHEDEAVVTCKGANEKWTIKCRNNQWEGNLGNCSNRK